MAFQKITRAQMLAYVKDALSRGSIYVWGACGQEGAQISASWIRGMETSATNAARAIATWEKRKRTHDPDRIRAFDCSGLVQACVNANGNPGWDDTAEGLRRRCVEIPVSQLRAGDLVFEWNGRKSGHVGVYIGGGRVIEARGRDYGVCETSLGARNWRKYGRPDWLYREDTAGQTDQPAGTPAVPFDFGRCARMGERSGRVRWVQERLKRHNALSGKVDGIFGSGTRAGVLAFQKARVAEGRDTGGVDGVVGPKTAAILAE